MSATERLRIAVIGLGGMGAGHVATIREQVPGMELAAVCGRDPARVAEHAQRAGVPGFTSLAELIASGCCQAVVIATPHPQHAAMATACLDADLDVIVEKPLTESIASSRRLVALAESRGRTLAVIFNQRTTPTHAALIKLVRDGAIGAVRRFTLISPDIRTQAYYDSGAWRATWRGEGGGVAINQGSHLLDVLVQAIGLPETVQAWTAAKGHDIEVEDVVEARLVLPGGASGFYHASTVEPRIDPLIEIIGDRGRLALRDTLRHWRFDPPTSQFIRDEPGMWTRPAPVEVPVELPAGSGSHGEVFRNVARHILHGEPLRFSGSSALGQVELTCALLMSGHLGRAVTLPLDGEEYDAFLAERRDANQGVKANLREQRVTDPGSAPSSAKATAKT